MEECKGDGKNKGYCCQNTPENQRPVEAEDLEKINKIAKGKIFKKDDKGNFYPNQVPLIRPNGRWKGQKYRSMSMWWNAR